jgi:hypothetical protein
MASIIAHAKVDPDTKKLLADIAADLAALKGKVDAVVVDFAAHRTTINAIITEAGTSLAAVAAVTPAAAATTTAATLQTSEK